MADTVYGIDLGTTYSAIAYVNDLDTPEVVNNLEGAPTTPSAIYFETADNVVVGAEAKNMALSDPDNVCTLIKRHMGTDYRVNYQGQEYSPEALSALILKEMVHAANQETGLDARKVVITVPAYFGVQEREATRQAGEIAGLEVIGIVTEPVAAALSLGLRTTLEDGATENVMVYDLGGGTFDTTVMSVSKGKLEVIAVDGDRVLGGADWDSALVSFILDKFVEAANLDRDEVAADDDFMADLHMQAENTKKSLTKKQSATVLCNYEGEKQTVTVTREEFEEATAHLLAQTVVIAERTVALAQDKEPGLTIDRVLLVGGSARMPMVAAALKDKLGWDAEATDFDLAVAKGAAIYGQSSEEDILATSDSDETPAADAPARYFLGGASSIQVSNVLARGVGIKFQREEGGDSYINFFAHANDRLPLDVEPIGALTVAEGQTQVDLSLFEQGGDEESDIPEHNKFMKSVDLPFGKPMPKHSPIEIEITVDAEGTVRLQATDPESRNRADLEVRTAVLSQEDVERATEQVTGLSLRS